MNTASRKESRGVAGRVQVSDDARERLEARFVLEARSAIEVKGKGPMQTFLIVEPKSVP